MKKYFLGLIVGWFCCMVGTTANKEIAWKSDFSNPVKVKGMMLPKDWEISGTKRGVNNSVYSVRKNKDGVPILYMSSDKGRGGLMYKIEGLD